MADVRSVESITYCITGWLITVTQLFIKLCKAKGITCQIHTTLAQHDRYSLKENLQRGVVFFLKLCFANDPQQQCFSPNLTVCCHNKEYDEAPGFQLLCRTAFFLKGQKKFEPFVLKAELVLDKPAIKRVRTELLWGVCVVNVLTHLVNQTMKLDKWPSLQTEHVLQDSQQGHKEAAVVVIVWLMVKN